MMHKKSEKARSFQQVKIMRNMLLSRTLSTWRSCTFTLFFIDKFWPTNCNRYLRNIFGYVPPNTWPTPCLRILLRRINTTAVVIIKIVIAIEKLIIKAIILLRFDFGL